jgi:hypothetical protein
MRKPRARRLAAMKQLPSTVIAALDKSKIVGIRVGREHRFIGVWPIVVEGRLFVRSWTRKPDGWHRAFSKDPSGAIQVGTRKIPVRAVPVRSERMKKAVDLAYRTKFNTPASLKYVRGFHRPSRRNTTTEFVPAGRSGSATRPARPGRRRV